MALPLLLPEPAWPPGLAPLKNVDDLLRCGICFDYFSIAVIIPQCSHNYCSLCIRKFLSYKTQCPTCCVAVSESDLKSNRTLDELVKSFHSARQQLLQLVRAAPAAGSRGRSPPAEGGPGPGRPPGQDEGRPPARAWGPPGSGQQRVKREERRDPHGASAERGAEDPRARGSPQGTGSREKPSTSVGRGATKVECPVCEVAIPEQYINKHLDSCLSREEKKDSLRSSAHKRKPMSKVVYNLLSDRDLRKKLRELGLSTSGSRQQLVRRHQEFVHMYNAQCDSLSPKAVAEVVKELEKNEKIRVQLECHKPSDNSLTFTKDQTEEEIDEIHAEYRSKHRSEFKLLVDQVNKRWKKSGGRKTESARSKGGAAVTELPAATEPREEHHTAGEAQELHSETPDGRGNEPPCVEEEQRSASPEFSLSPGSTSSTNSDILADVEESETCSASSGSSSVPLTGSRRRPRQPRVPEQDGGTPRSKRKRS